MSNDVINKLRNTPTVTLVVSYEDMRDLYNVTVEQYIAMVNDIRTMDQIIIDFRALIAESALTY